MIKVPQQLQKINYNIPTYGGNIFRKDYLSTSSIIYFACLTIIMFTTFYYGNKGLLDITNNNYAHLIFIIILITIYIIFLGMYYLNWTLESIFVMILFISVLFGLVAFIVLYFGNEICTEIKEEGERKFMKYLFVFLELLVIYLGFYNRNEYSNWNIYDTLRFVFLLFVIRFMYYIVKHNDMPMYKTIIDITMIIVLYMNGKRMYQIFKSMDIKIDVPKNLKSVKY